MVQGLKFPWPGWVVGRRQAPELTLFEAEAFVGFSLQQAKARNWHQSMLLGPRTEGPVLGEAFK